MGPFTAKTYDFSGGSPFWYPPQQAIEAVLRAGEGKIGGPVRDLMGGEYLVQLVEKIVPDENAWKNDFPGAKTEIEKALLQRRQQERFEDYVAHLRNRADVPILKNDQVLAETLGLKSEATSGQSAPAPAPGAPEAPTAPASPVAATAPASNESISTAAPAGAPAPNAGADAPAPPVEAPPPVTVPAPAAP